MDRKGQNSRRLSVEIQLYPMFHLDHSSFWSLAITIVKGGSNEVMDFGGIVAQGLHELTLE